MAGEFCSFQVKHGPLTPLHGLWLGYSSSVRIKRLWHNKFNDDRLLWALIIRV